MKNIVKLIILVAIIFSFQWGCKENLLTENNPIPEQTSILQNAEVQYMHQKLCNQIDEIIGCQVSKIN